MRIVDHTKDGHAVKRTLIALITDTTVVAAVAAKYEPDLFGVPDADLIAGWCVRHYKKRQVAPGREVEGYFERWQEAKGGKDNDTVKKVSQFLASLNGEYARLKKTLNPDHQIEVASELFAKVRLRRMADRVRDALDNGDLKGAEEAKTACKPFDLTAKAGIDLGLDETVVDKLYARAAETIVQYKGPIGAFLNPGLVRGGFAAFLGGEKSTKSWWLMDIGWRAMKQGKKVAFFEVGDQTEIDLYGRLISRQAKAPFRVPKDGRTDYQYPTALETGGILTTEDVPFVGNLPKRLAKAAYAKLAEGWDGPRMRLSFHSGNSISVDGIRSTLDGWARGGWEPDCVICDYADLLAPLDRKLDKRDQINESWIALRAVSMDRHVLVVTATQANRVGYGATVLSKEHISDDKRKVGHVTVLYGINRNAEEKGKGQCRINVIDAREFSYNPTKVVHVAGCLELARPAILSSW